MNETSIPAPRLKAVGTITYKCYECHEMIVDEEPVLTHIDGRLVALHRRHQQKEPDRGR